MSIHLPFVGIGYINRTYLKEYYMHRLLRNIWPLTASAEKSGPDLGRRGALRFLMTGAAALGAATLPGGNEAQAQEKQTVGLTAGERGLDGVQGIRDMLHYSEEPETKGIGVFINLQANAPMTGEQIGEWVKAQFANVNVPVEYRFNQSKGTGTDLTFFVRGVDYVHNIDDVPTKLPQVYASHQGAWLPETVALNEDGPKVTRN